MIVNYPSAVASTLAWGSVTALSLLSCLAISAGRLISFFKQGNGHPRTVLTYGSCCREKGILLILQWWGACWASFPCAPPCFYRWCIVVLGLVPVGMLHFPSFFSHTETPCLPKFWIIVFSIATVWRTHLIVKTFALLKKALVREMYDNIENLFQYSS